MAPTSDGKAIARAILAAGALLAFAVIVGALIIADMAQPARYVESRHTGALIDSTSGVMWWPATNRMQRFPAH